MSLDPGRRCVAQAGGKVILLGEHAVVYGSRAIALGLAQGARAEVRRAAQSELVLAGQRHVLGPAGLDTGEPLPACAFRALLGALEAPAVVAEAWLELPAGAGLGASAALGVALARAAAGFSPGASISAGALAWENVFHGNASGVDTAAAEQGGCISFRRGEAPRKLRPGAALEVVVALVAPGASTRQMVESVAARREAEKGPTERLLADIAALAEEAEAAIAAGQTAELGRLMTRNHELLAELGVSTPELNQACRHAVANGALGAKLTGAGGGGCAIALVDASSRAAVLDAWQVRGFSCWQARAEGP